MFSIIGGLIGGVASLGTAAIEAWAGVTIAKYAFYGIVVGACVKVFEMIKTYLKPLFEAVGQLAKLFVNIVERVFNGILEWFRSKILRKGVDVPFISTDQNIGKYLETEGHKPNYEAVFQNDHAFFTGIYDMNTGRIRDGRIVEFQNADSETIRAINAAKEGNGYAVLTE